MNIRKPSSQHILAFLLLLILSCAGCGSDEPEAPKAQIPPQAALQEAASAPQSAGATIGIFRPTSRAFAISLTFLPGFTHNTVRFGSEEDLPVAGDWNGTGFAKVGVYRPSDATFRLLDKNIADGQIIPDTAATSVQFGMKGDIPIAGDWDGNHTATIGVYRPSDLSFYLRNSNTPGKPDLVVPFGKNGDIPVTGDWDGNGSWTVGVYRPSDLTFYLRNSNTPGEADVTVAYGAAGDTPIVGDWDGNGTTTVGVRRGITFSLRNENSPGNADTTIAFASADDRPVAGKWSRD